MKSTFKGKTVLVTGGTGTIGSEIVKSLMEYNVEKVIVFSRDEIKQFLLKKRITDDRLETVIGDVRDYSSLKRVFRDFKIDVVYHTAAMKHVVMCENFPIECVKTNIIGTQNVVDLARRYDVAKLITISTDKAANPTNVMGASKFIAERITLNAGYTCVRFGNVACSRGSVIPVFIDSLLNSKRITLSDPNVTRFIIKIEDAVKLIFKATEYAIGCEIFILKMKAFKLGDLLDVIINDIAPRLEVVRESIEVNTVGLALGEKLHEELINITEVDNIYELENMYVVIVNRDKLREFLRKYPHAKKISLKQYRSDKVELVSKEELKEIVLKYLETLRGQHDKSNSF